MNSLSLLVEVFENNNNEIMLSQDTIDKAMIPLQRMLNFNQRH